MVFITIVTGAYKPTYILGASHCMYIYIPIVWGSISQPYKTDAESQRLCAARRGEGTALRGAAHGHVAGCAWWPLGEMAQGILKHVEFHGRIRHNLAAN